MAHVQWHRNIVSCFIVCIQPPVRSRRENAIVARGGRGDAEKFISFAQRTQRRREILPPRHQGTKNLIPLSSRSQIAIQLLLPYRDLLENLRSISLFCPQINADVLKLKTKISAAQPSIFTNANLPSPAMKTDSVESFSPRHFSVSIYLKKDYYF